MGCFKEHAACKPTCWCKTHCPASSILRYTMWLTEFSLRVVLKTKINPRKVRLKT